MISSRIYSRVHPRENAVTVVRAPFAFSPVTAVDCIFSRIQRSKSSLSMVPCSMKHCSGRPMHAQDLLFLRLILYFSSVRICYQ